MLVMLAHLYDAELKYSSDQLLGPWTLYGNLGVDIFFMISGFIMVHVTWQKQRSLASAKDFLLARIGRIYPLYWVVSLAVLMVALIRPDMVFSSREIDPVLWKSFLLVPDLTSPLLLVGWTLIFEMYFYIIFTVFMLFGRRHLVPALGLWALIILVGQVLGWRSHGPTAEVVFNPLTYEFIIGAALAIFIRKGSKPLSLLINPAGMRALGLVLIIAWLFPLFLLGILPESYVIRVGAFIIPLTLTLLYAAIRDELDLKIWRPFISLGDWSYSLYLTHILSIAIIGRLWSSYVTDGLLDNIFAVMIMVVFSIVIAAVTYHVIERPALKVVRILRKRQTPTTIYED